MTNKEIKYRMDFKKKTSLPFSIFIGIFLFLGALIFGNLVYIIVGEPERINGLLFVMILIIIVLVFVLDILLWQLKGVEILIISDKIELIKNGKLFKMRKSIDFNELESISIDNDPDTPFLIKLFGLSGGKIIIKYLGRSTRIGQDISISYAEIAVEELDKVISRTINNKA